MYVKNSEIDLLRVYIDILRSIDNGESVILVLRDLSTAFDIVNAFIWFVNTLWTRISSGLPVI